MAVRLLSRPSAAPAVYFLLVVLIVGVLLAFFLTWTYQLAGQGAGTSSLNEATILSTRVETTLRRTNATSNWIADQLADAEWPQQRRADGKIYPDRELAALGTDFPEVASFMVFDDQGRIAMASNLRQDDLSVAH